MNFCPSELLNHIAMRFLAALMYPQILLVYKTLFLLFLIADLECKVRHYNFCFFSGPSWLKPSINNLVFRFQLSDQ
jgi:hypothetical protein